MNCRVRVDQIGQDPVLCSAWRAYTQCSPAATVYHDLAWREIFGLGFGYRAIHLLARSKSDDRVVGALPLFEVPSFFGRPRLVAVPFRDRGGPIYDDKDALDALLAAAGRLTSERHSAGLVLKSLTPLPEASAAKARLSERRHWICSVADLRNLDEAELWRRLGDKTRNMVRQGERAELIFREITADPGAARLWYRLHLGSQRKLGLPPFPKGFFELIIDSLRTNGQARMFAATRQDQTPVAVAITLHEKRRAIYAYGAADLTGRGSRPVDFILHRLMCWLINMKIDEFDMGSDAPEQESLLFFKRKFLAEQKTVPVYLSQGVCMETSDSSAPRYRTARNLVRRVPEALSARLLSRTVRYFG